MTYATDLCGVKSGRDLDKWQAAGLTPQQASAVDVPLVAESPVNIECQVVKVEELGSHHMFIAEVKAVDIDEKYLEGQISSGEGEAHRLLPRRVLWAGRTARHLRLQREKGAEESDGGEEAPRKVRTEKEWSRMKKNNITLIGMPGAGKSTVGVLLAKRLGYSFVDVDIVIQEQEKRLLKEIIADEGMDGFLEVENRVNAGLNVERSVIAPGGSVIYGKEAMEHLKDIGVVVYLKLSYRALERRLGDLVDRGVALKEGMTLRDLYNERKVYYEKYADITIDEAGKTVGRIVDELRAIMEARISEEKEG